MKYLETNLIDATNEKFLEISAVKLADNNDIAKIIIEAFEKNGYKKANGSGSYMNWYESTSFSFKYGFRDYIRFGIYKTAAINACCNFSPSANIIETCIQTKTHQTTIPHPKTPNKFLTHQIITIDFSLLDQMIAEHKVKKVEIKQNKSVSKFKKDLFLPWFMGHIQEVIPDFEKANVGSRHNIIASYQSQTLRFNIESREMTKKEFSDIEFDDIRFKINMRIEKQGFNSSGLSMDGLKNALANFKEIKKFVDSEDEKFKNDTKPFLKNMSDIENQIAILNQEKHKTKEKIEALKVESKKRIAKFANTIKNN